MSKIYEALLRAEIERLTAASGDGEKPEVGLPEPEALLGPGMQTARAGVTADLTPASLPDAAPAYVRSHAASTASRSELIFERIPAQRWNVRMPSLPTLEQRGAIVEQFRSLRARLYEFRDLGTLNSVMVSSASPREGKSFTSINLAIALARHKATRVLLIDGDMRRGTLHDILGTRKGPGLTEYLSGRSSMAEVVQRGFAPEGAEPLPRGLNSLAFVPCGLDHEQAADLSGSVRFGQLLQAAQDAFDWVIVDSSPVTLVTDGVNLSRSCDGVLLVARAGFTRFEVAQKALTELRATRMLGVVLNDAEESMSGGAYYGYGTYYAA